MKNIVIIFLLFSCMYAKFIRFDEAKVVIDTQTRLMWSDNFDQNSKWNDALTYCNNLSLSAIIGTNEYTLNKWRLPNQNELLTLIGYKKTNHALPEAFKFIATTNSSNFFSSTTYKPDSTKVYGINREIGLDIILEKDRDFFVKCIMNLE